MITNTFKIIAIFFVAASLALFAALVFGGNTMRAEAVSVNSIKANISEKRAHRDFREKFNNLPADVQKALCDIFPGGIAKALGICKDNSSSDDLVIRGVDISLITETSAKVTWNTNDPADSYVVYGVDNDFTDTDDFRAGTSADTKNHSVMLESLKAGKTYYLRVMSENDKGSVTSGTYKFVTKASADTSENPVISNIDVDLDIASGDITVAFITNEATKTEITYWKKSDEANKKTVVVSNEFKTSHTITLTDLESDTDYSFTLKATDAGGASGTVTSQILL